MARTVSVLLPASEALLRQLGDRLRVARLRRRLPAKQVAARAGMAPMTLRAVERGAAGATIGAYAAVLQVLGLETDLNLVASADPLGRTLQDAQLPVRGRSAQTTQRSTKAATPKTAARPGHTAARPAPKKTERSKRTKTVRGRAEGGFVTARALAGLLDLPSTSRAKARRR